MKRIMISKGGQVSIPASIRRRWGTSALILEDEGAQLVLRPAPDDVVAAVRGVLKGRISSSEELRAQARAEEDESERRRWGD